MADNKEVPLLTAEKARWLLDESAAPWEPEMQAIARGDVVCLPKSAAERLEAVDGVETGWLVENHEGGTIRYLYIDNNHEAGPYLWTTDNLKACRFARRVDAEMAAEGGELLDLRICEHQWSPSC